MLKLGVRQRKFCLAYLEGQSGVQSAIAAGYSKAGAGQQANRMLKMRNVVAYLAEQAAKLEENIHVDAAWVLTKLVLLARNARVKDSDRLRALELIGRHRGVLAFAETLKTDDQGLVNMIYEARKRAEEERAKDEVLH